MIQKDMVLKKSKTSSGHGFTIIETLVSLLLVFLALLITLQITVSAVEAYRRSRDGFFLLQEMEAFKNRLQGTPFNAPQWQEGCTEEIITPFKVVLEVQNLGPELKYARLTFTYMNKYIKTHTEFYKSLYITNRSKKSS